MKKFRSKLSGLQWRIIYAAATIGALVLAIAAPINGGNG